MDPKDPAVADAKTARKLIAETVELLKQCSAAAKDLKHAGLTESLINSRENLQTLREMLAGIAEENAELGRKLQEITQAADQVGKMVRSSGVYWVKGDNDPWCPNCWESDRKAMHLNPSGLMGGRLVRCSRCEYSINLDNVSPPTKWPDE